MIMMKKLMAAVLAVLMLGAVVLVPSVEVRADEVSSQDTAVQDATEQDASAQQDTAALTEEQQAAIAAAQAHAAALAVDLRGFLGQNPDTVAQTIGGFIPYPQMLDGSYYTDGAVEFWGNAASGIRSVQIIAATTGNIAGVTYGTNFDAAADLLKASGWTQMHTGGRRSAFRDGDGNLLSVAYNPDRAIFWVNYLKIY